jgi:hypothetical protein
MSEKNFQITTKLLLVALCFGFLLTGAGTTLAMEGILACRGSNLLLSGGVEGNRVYSAYHLTNFNDTGTITIDKMLVYGNDGTSLCNFPADVLFPASFKSTLGAYENTTITTLQMNAAGCLPNPNYPQLSNATRVIVVIYWSSALNKKHIPLDVMYTDNVQDLNVATLYNHMGISSNECKVLP